MGTSEPRVRYAVYNGPNFMSCWATRDLAEQSVAALAYLKLPLEIVVLQEKEAVDEP